MNTKTEYINARLIKNSIAGLSRSIITVPIFLVLTPFMLNKLGIELYGIWAISSVITAYASLSDLGITTGLTRFVAKYWSNNEYTNVNKSVTTVFCFYFITSLLLIIIISWSSTLISNHIFKIPSRLLGDVQFVIIGACLTFSISIFSSLYGSIIQGIQRNDLWNILLLFNTIIDTIAIFIILNLGLGVKTLIIGRIAVTFISLLVSMFVAHLVFRPLIFRRSYFEFRFGLVIIKYSLNIFLSKFAATFRDPILKVIISNLTSIGGLTFFDVGSRIANQIQGLFGSMMAPLLPAATSSYEINSGFEQIKNIYYKCLIYIQIFAFPLIGGLIVFANPIINLWIGSGYKDVIVTMRILLLVCFFAIVETPAWTIMEGIGLARVTSRISISTAIIGFILGIFGGILGGYKGFIYGYSISRIMMSLLILIAFTKYTRISHHNLYGLVPWRMTTIVIIVLLSFYLYLTFGLINIQLKYLLVLFLLYGLIFTVTLLTTRSIDYTDLKKLVALFFRRSQVIE